MCGISGIVSLSDNLSGSSTPIKSMTKMLEHRGPNAFGLYLDDQVHLGQARLSIIDLNTGSQPIHNEDKSIWIIFNGEIYNYPDLRKYLQQRGHRFYTHSDTEVIVHLYEEEKSECVNKLNGQFAFAIWDSNEKTLFAARDRFGKKPFYYSRKENKLIFASEIKSLLVNNEIEKEIDPRGLSEVLTFWSTLPGGTIFKDVYELPAGHSIQVKNGNVFIKKYWDINFAERKDFIEVSKDEIIKQAEELLYDSIKIRLRADVPVGCYLSGGLDSSGITSIVKNDFNNYVRSFGISFEEKKFDESSFQRKMADSLKIDHSEIIAKNELISQNIFDTIWHTETPLTRLSPVPLKLLSNFVKESGLKVILTGEGADEIFAGYNIFKETLIRYHWSKDPNSKLKPKLLLKLYPYIFDEIKNEKLLSSFFRVGIDNFNNPLFSHLIRWKNTERLKRFLSSEILDEVKKYNAFEKVESLLPSNFQKLDALSKAQYLETKIFLSNYLLSSQGDRVAMANSIEVRMPYLDYRLAELISKVPSYYRLRGLQEKYLLKRILSKRLPPEIVNRPKTPYRSPINQSLLKGKAKLLGEHINESKINEKNIFKFSAVNKLHKKLESSQHVSEFEDMALTAILTTQIFHDQFIANPIVVDKDLSEFDLVFDYRRKTIEKAV